MYVIGHDDKIMEDDIFKGLYHVLLDPQNYSYFTFDTILLS